MAHLNEEQIASLAEGNIEGAEHERLLKHLADCEDCFNAYTDTVTLIEEERKRNAWWKRIIRKLLDYKKAPGRLSLPGMGTLIPQRILVPAVSILIVVLVIALAIIIPQNKIKAEKVGYALESSKENIKNYGLVGSNNKVFAAVRTGIFLKDLYLLVDAPGEEEQVIKIIGMLNNELKTLGIEGESILHEPENINKKKIEKMMRIVQGKVKDQKINELFRFGLFLESTILATFEGKRPKQENIEKYLRTTTVYVEERKLPQGVAKQLKKLTEIKTVAETKSIFIRIKNLFFI